MELIKPNTNYDFMGKARFFAILSGVVTTLSILGFFVYPQPKYGIDFGGGTELQVEVGQGVDSAMLRKALESSGFKGADVIAFGQGNTEYLIRIPTYTPVSPEKEKAVRSAIGQAFPSAKLQQFDLSPGGDKLTLRFSAPIDKAVLGDALNKSGLELRKINLTAEPSSADKKVAAGEEEDEAAVDKEAAAAMAERCTDPICPKAGKEENAYEVFLQGIGAVVIQQLKQKLGEQRIKAPRRIEWVGPKIGKQLRDAGIKSMVYAMLLIMVYIAFRFDLRFAPGAVVATLHDATFTAGVFVFTRMDFTMETIAALLTIIGYSVNDTIVVFDRIRENFQKYRERDLKMVINRSINEMLGRTILTSLTVIFVSLVIFVMSSGPIKNFAFALTFGVVVGTYSSIYIAAPIVVWLDQRFFHKK